MIGAPESLDFFEPVETPLLVPDDNGTLYNPKGYLIPPGYLTDNIMHPHPLWRKLVGRIEGKRQQRILVPELENCIVTAHTVSEMRLAYLSTTGSKTIYARNAGRPDCKYLPPSTGGITNNELAREYLRCCLEAKEGKIAKCPRRNESYLSLPATLYYEGGRKQGSYAYVDISSAYWTIHKTATIDMRYEPGQWVLTGGAPYRDVDEVTAYRGLRHAIPGSLKISEMQIFRYGEGQDCSFKGKFSYPGIVGYCMHVMHAIAREVIDHFGASMILTDAYIVPQDRAQELVRFLWERWGVGAVIKAQGSGALYGLNVYQVGPHPAGRSGHAPVRWTTAKSWTYISEEGKEMTLVPDSSRKDNLEDVDSFWLQKQRMNLLEKGLGQGTLCDSE